MTLCQSRRNANLLNIHYKVTLIGSTSSMNYRPFCCYIVDVLAFCTKKFFTISIIEDEKIKQ